MLALSALSGWAPAPRGRVGAAYEKIVDRLVGRTPSVDAPVEHVEVDAEAPERALREHGGPSSARR
jgi:hypothetical protein